MKIKIHNSKDFYAGLLFIFFGLFAVIVAATSYPIGNAVHMGPGIFPIILGGMLILIGIVVAARVLWLGGETIEPISPRPLFMVSAGLVMFALLVEPLGFILAILALVVIGALGGWEFRVREVLVLCLVLAALAVGVFVYAIGMPINLWPG